jgi:signal transduction histidine kinase
VSSTPVHILLVDDKPENLLVLEELLKRPDRHFVRAGSGNDALRLLLKQDFAVVLLDVQMPEMNGYETAQLMRGTAATRSVPIIFVTAGDRTEESAFRAYEVGAVDFLYKPVNPQLLRNKVDVFVELHRRNLDLRGLNIALERAGAALREKIEDLESVNRTISHDLRAPLRSICGFTQILAESLEGKLDADGEHCLDRILQAGDRMGRMLDDLFALLRLSAAEETFPVTDCASVLRDTLDDLGADIASAAAEVVHETLPTLRVNPTLLRQIFQNLIANALKFRGADPLRIQVTAARQDEAWRLSVRDNGIGIPDESRERIFGLFERLGGDRFPGTGVGLALCKRAAEKQGGQIWVESTVGEGSTFHFTIPVRL